MSDPNTEPDGVQPEGVRVLGRAGATTPRPVPRLVIRVRRVIRCCTGERFRSGRGVKGGAARQTVRETRWLIRPD